MSFFKSYKLVYMRVLDSQNLQRFKTLNKFSLRRTVLAKGVLLTVVISFASPCLRNPPQGNNEEEQWQGGAKAALTCASG